jgi:hypothetical protein
VEFFVYCRDRAGSVERRWELVEEHWSFMDRYAASMIARGPTMTADRSAPTGSLHIVDLPGPEAVREFAFDEPNYRAGIYEEVLIRRFVKVLGRTMWEFGGTAEDSRYLVLGNGSGEIPAGQDGGVIVAGRLLSQDGAEALGTAILAEAPDAASARALLGRSDRTEVHAWQFGGRR